MKVWKALLMTGVTAISCLSATPSFADYLPGEKAREQQVYGLELVVEYLSIEQFVPSRLEFRKMTADPVADLVEVATDNGDIRIRTRAIQSLALYRDDARAIETVDALMTRVKPGNRMFGPTLVTWVAIHGESVVDAVLPYTSHKDDGVRLAAVIALGRFGGQSGYDALVELSDIETAPAVLARINAMVD